MPPESSQTDTVFLGGFFGVGGYSFCMCLRLFLDSKMGVASYLLHTWPITSPVVNLVIDATWQRTFTCTPCFHLLIVPSPQFFFIWKHSQKTTSTQNSCLPCHVPPYKMHTLKKKKIKLHQHLTTLSQRTGVCLCVESGRLTSLCMA